MQSLHIFSDEKPEVYNRTSTSGGKVFSQLPQPVIATTRNMEHGSHNPITNRITRLRSNIEHGRRSLLVIKNGADSATERFLLRQLKHVPLVYGVQCQLGTGQLIADFFIVGLHCRQIVVGVGIVDDIGLPPVLFLHPLLGQTGFHVGQLVLALGQLRDVHQHLVDGHTELRDNLGGVEHVDGVLHLADTLL